MIKERLDHDMKIALKAGEKARLSVIRMLLSELKNERIAQGKDLDEAAEQKVLVGYAKKRKEAMEVARTGGRDDIVAREQMEYDVTMSYLPQQLSEAELRALIQRHIDGAGATGPQAFGLVMKSVMAEVGGQAEGKRVSALVREMLA